MNGTGTAATDVFRYKSGDLYFDHDGVNGGDDVLIANLETAPASLIASDFHLVA